MEKLRLKAIILLMLCWALNLAALPSDLGATFSKKFRNVLIDLRQSRGGNGDVAAGYLTLMDLLTRYKVSNHITLLVDQEGQKRLQGLQSTLIPFPNNVEVATLDDLPEPLVIDFYLALASPSGTLKNRPREQLNFATQALLVVQTVLGNTENPRSLNPMALVDIDGMPLNMPPAGLGENESGIYGDFIAAILRGKDEAFTREFLLEHIKGVSHPNAQSQLQDILVGKSLQGAKIGLVYGITSMQTRPQFTSYLSGLTRQKEQAFCLISPSKFNLDHIDNPDLRRRITVLDSQSELPAKAIPGQIYILKTPNLPHPVFVGLTHLSMKQGLPPVGAGDGFLSAAITLGEPFVLTRIAWNENNIRNLKQRLLLNPVSSREVFQRLLDSIYGEINFENALDLQNFREAYWELSNEIPILTDYLLQSAVQIRTMLEKNPPTALNEKELAKLSLSLQESKGARELPSPKSEVEAYIDFAFEQIANDPNFSPDIKEILLGRANPVRPKGTYRQRQQAATCSRTLR